MVNQQTLEGNWNEISGKIRERWGQMTNDELQQFEGSADQLVGLIQRRTGEARDKIEQYLNQITEGGSAGVSRAAENIRQYASQARDTVRGYADDASHRVQESYEEAALRMREGYAVTEDMVRRHPLESVAVCFGAGVLTGVVLGLMLRSK